MISQAIIPTFNLDASEFNGVMLPRRYLEDLRGRFADAPAYAEALAQGNPLLPSVSTVEPASGAGQLHYGLGLLMPGRIRTEYFMTKPPLHSWRDATEVYVGLCGDELLLQEDQDTGESKALSSRLNTVAHVPGQTFDHQPMNSCHE